MVNKWEHSLAEKLRQDFGWPSTFMDSETYCRMTNRYRGLPVGIISYPEQFGYIRRIQKSERGPIVVVIQLLHKPDLGTQEVVPQLVYNLGEYLDGMRDIRPKTHRGKTTLARQIVQMTKFINLVKEGLPRA